jgi:hypothetical protein
LRVLRPSFFINIFRNSHYYKKMLRSSDLQSLQEAYQNIYEETDGISLEMIEEIVEELVEECVEYGYTLDEAADVVETAALLYIDEAKITYGSDTESPEQRRERAKGRLGGMKSSARKAAVKGAVERVKAKAKGAKAMAGIAGSIAKDEAKRAGRAAKQAVTGAVQKKKAEVKKGVKGLLGRGLRAAAGAAGSVAQKARKAASAAGRAAERLGEEVIGEAEGSYGATPKAYSAASKTKMTAKRKPFLKAMKRRTNPANRTPDDSPRKGLTADDRERARAGAAHGVGTRQDHDYPSQGPGGVTKSAKKLRKQKAMGEIGESYDIFDVVLEYLLDTGHAETISEAQYIMSQMDSESIDSMLDEAMTNYEKNRKRAAQRAAARNEARAQGKTGAVPGVGYVTPRRERETWTDESGKTRHAKGL